MAAALPLPTALVFLDYFGIAVFAISGALLAAEKRQTLVTFIFFAVVTGVGGGTLRDLLIGAPVFWVHVNAHLADLHRRRAGGVADQPPPVRRQGFAVVRRRGPRRLCDLRRRQGPRFRSRAGAGLRDGRDDRLRRRDHPRRPRRRAVDPDAAGALRHRRRARCRPVRRSEPCSESTVWAAAAIAIAAGFALRGAAIARGWSLPAYRD